MFEWDESKRLANIAKHRLDFLDATKAFDGRNCFQYVSIRNNEERFVTIASIDDRFWAVVWIPRKQNKRIISAHRATNAEIRQYHRLFSH